MRVRDQAQRLKAQHRGAQRGIYLYIDARSLERAGRGENGAQVYYRVWAAPSGSLTVRLYREP